MTGARKRDLFVRSEGDSERAERYETPIVERLVEDGPAYNPTALVLVPTRELAIQIHEEFFQLSSRGTTARILGAIEGKPLTSQIGPLKHGVDIVVGTPGRVLEHVKRRTLRIEQLKILVLDRADQIIDLGLARDIEAILEQTPKTRQTIVLAETTPPHLLSLAHKHLREPELIGIERDELEAVAPKAPAARLTNIYFGIGKGAGVTPRDLVGTITNEGGLSGDQIGVIKIKQNFSLVAVPEASAKEIVSRLRSTSVKGRKTKIRLERFN